MTVASEITRLQNAKASIKTSIENKGVTVGSSLKLDGYSACIDAIPTGSSTCMIDALVVAGGGSGGGGGACGGGGGGAGQVLLGTVKVLSSALPITIGAGGTSTAVCGIGGYGGCTTINCVQFYKVCGCNSYIYTCMQAIGGGPGGTTNGAGGARAAGGSGGGAGYALCKKCCIISGGFNGTANTSGGNPGGKTGYNLPWSYTGGGGGGYTTCGGDGMNISYCGGGSGCGCGGYGGYWNNGVTFCFAGGGGGGGYSWTGCGCSGGGDGGGGTNAGCPATTYGSGGGGGGIKCLGGAGCQGVVVIRYPTDGSYGFKTSTGGNCCVSSGGWCTVMFTSNGTFTITG